MNFATEKMPVFVHGGGAAGQVRPNACQQTICGAFEKRSCGKFAGSASAGIGMAHASRAYIRACAPVRVIELINIINYIYILINLIKSKNLNSLSVPERELFCSSEGRAESYRLNNKEEYVDLV